MSCELNPPAVFLLGTSIPSLTPRNWHGVNLPTSDASDSVARDATTFKTMLNGLSVRDCFCAFDILWLWLPFFSGVCSGVCSGGLLRLSQLRIQNDTKCALGERWYKALLATSTSPAQADVALAEQFNRTMSFKPELFLVLRTTNGNVPRIPKISRWRKCQTHPNTCFHHWKWPHLWDLQTNQVPSRRQRGWLQTSDGWRDGCLDHIIYKQTPAGL